MKLRRRSVLGSLGMGSLGSLAVLATPHVARATTRRFRLGHNNTANSVPHAFATGYGAALESASGGRFTIEIVPNSALGTETQMVKAVSEGTLDMTLVPNGTAATLARDVGLLEAPYLFRDLAHARACFDSAIGANASELLKPKGVIIAGWGEVGVRHITANKPVRTPADLRGLKIRVPVSEVILESFRAMGAAADILPFPQLPEALRTGRFEAQENPISVILISQLNTLQSHLSVTGHVFTSLGLAMSADMLEELSEGDRKLILGAAPAGVAANRAFADKVESDGLAALRTAGMTIVTDIDRAAFREASSVAYQKLGQIYGAETVQKIRALAA